MKPALKVYDWRVSTVKVLDVAEDAAAYAEAEAKRTAAFEGQYNALGQREGPLVRAVYENGDCYMGQYTDDQRSGKGMYIHANKAAFAGADTGLPLCHLGLWDSCMNIIGVQFWGHGRIARRKTQYVRNLLHMDTVPALGAVHCHTL